MALRSMPRGRAWPIAIAGVLLALTGCTSATQQAAPASTPAPTDSAQLDSYYRQKLDWQPCRGDFECATLIVPKDYDDLSVGDTHVSVLRQKPAGQDLGYLVVNPGGPGGSGVEYAAAGPAVVSAKVLKSYNLVGFDPRGVGGSDPVDCVSDKQLDKFIAADGEPDSPAEETQLLADAKAFGKGCAKNSAQMYQYMSTAAVVKDLDILRAALGQERLNYLGFSYGTLVGALYADQYGENVGRMVLDGVLPPQLTSEEISRGQAAGFEDSLRRYVASCQAKPDCPVAGDSVDAGVKKIQEFLDSLDKSPLPTNEGRPLTQSLGVGAVLYYLYFPYSGDWGLLTQGLKDAFAGDGSTLLSMYEQRLERLPNGTYKNNGQEAYYAVNCLDRGTDADAASLRQRAREWSKEAPTFGRYLAWSEAVCAEWPVRATGEPQQVTAEDAGPILVLGTTHDPATPISWAQLLTDQLADAHLVTWDSDGHTAYTNGSICVDDAVDAYLLDGTVPESGLVCK